MALSTITTTVYPKEMKAERHLERMLLSLVAMIIKILETLRTAKHS